MMDSELEWLVQTKNLKYIVRNYILTLDNVKKFIVTHEMKYDDDDVSPYMVSLCQPHLDKKDIYDAFE
jgi:hypothetical protein